MIPQKPSGNWLHAKETLGSIPDTDNLSHRPASDVPLATPCVDAKDDDFDMYEDAYEDADEAPDGQFEDAVGDAVSMVSASCAPPTDNAVPYPQFLLPPPLPLNDMKGSVAPASEKRKTPFAIAPTTTPRKRAPLPLNPSATDDKKPKARALDNPTARPNEGTPNDYVTFDKESSVSRGAIVNKLNFVPKFGEVNEGGYGENQISCNDVALRRGTQSRQHVGYVQ
jgi:hypothetical protein